MRIKSLQVHGFKSFVDRTVFTFKDGVTAVVGPNGCGKSNVVDAVRWVMGEQSARRLRGKGMEDVIFAGSETRPPIGMAEVVLTFDNEDGQGPPAYSAYTEIQVCRRLYRSGESEYLMNKTQVRMKDIQDFFRDSGIGAKGYTIVEQGKVAEIVSAKAEERRLLIEEAAGITKYKARRKEAESKIKSTEQNLTRVKDVLREINRQINSLERQARKAARYKRLRETQRILELSIAADERRELLASVGQARHQLTELKDAVTGLTTQLAERELGVEEKRIALVEAEKAVTAGAEQLFALRSEIKDLEAQKEMGRREAENITDANEGRRGELVSLRDQLSQSEQQAIQAQEELDQLELAVAGQQASVDAAEAEAESARVTHRALEQARDQANGGLVDLLTSIARAEDRLAAVADRRAEIDQRLRAADRDFEERQSETSEATSEQSNLEEGLRGLLADRDRFQDQLRSAMTQHEAAGEALRRAAEGLAQVRERHEARKARLVSLREVVARREDVGEATRHLMEQGDEVRRRFSLRGLVRDLLEVDAEVERAVEAVLSERAEAIVVGDGQGAVQAIETLRGQEAGRGIFIVERAISQPARSIVPLGEPLIGRVRAAEDFAGVARSLLADVYLVPSLEHVFERYGASDLPASFVTPAGDVITPDGVIRGGGEPAAGGMLSRVREVRELEEEVEALAARVREAEAAHESASRAQVHAASELDNMRNRHHTAVLAVANHEKDLERTAERVKTLGEAQENRVAERADLLAESEALAEEQARLEQQLGHAREDRTRVQADLDATVLKLGTAAREVSRLETHGTELRVAHAARVENRDRLRLTVERAGGSARETSDWIARREREIEHGELRLRELEDQQARLDETLTSQLEAEEAARAHSDELRDAFERQAADVRALEESLRDVRGDLSSRQEQAASAELTLRESEMRLNHQAESIRERWDVELARWELPPLEPVPSTPAGDAEADADSAEALVAARLRGEAKGAPETTDGTAESEPGPSTAGNEGEGTSAGEIREARRNAEMARLPREERQKELEGLRKSLQSLGDVNLGAIEEHEELAERSRFLAEQQADLESTIESLREAIGRINRTSRRRFRETFEAVSKRFSENFPRLFGGGKASLVLTESEDVLEAGIDIMAMPPGKRLQNVNLLSGGEKTMTALALLVAVFQVRPSPFFLLDEVDAALDDANVGRFNQLITEMADHSQFLVITHNKRTIEVADVLYGVTMEQKGVSKLVAVTLS